MKKVQKVIGIIEGQALNKLTFGELEKLKKMLNVDIRAGRIKGRMVMIMYSKEKVSFKDYYDLRSEQFELRYM